VSNSLLDTILKVSVTQIILSFVPVFYALPFEICTAMASGFKYTAFSLLSHFWLYHWNLVFESQLAKLHSLTLLIYPPLITGNNVFLFFLYKIYPYEGRDTHRLLCLEFQSCHGHQKDMHIAFLYYAHHSTSTNLFLVLCIVSRDAVSSHYFLGILQD
jgi:hypothetical protein